MPKPIDKLHYFYLALLLPIAVGCGAPKLKPAAPEAELIEHTFGEIPPGGANREDVSRVASQASLALAGSEFKAKLVKRQKLSGHNGWGVVGMNDKDFYAVQLVEYDGKLIAVSCGKNSEIVWEHPAWSTLRGK